jgi:hypothetical protein
VLLKTLCFDDSEIGSVDTKVRPLLFKIGSLPLFNPLPSWEFEHMLLAYLIFNIHFYLRKPLGFQLVGCLVLGFQLVGS